MTCLSPVVDSTPPCIIRQDINKELKYTLQLLNQLPLHWTKIEERLIPSKACSVPLKKQT